MHNPEYDTTASTLDQLAANPDLLLRPDVLYNVVEQPDTWLSTANEGSEPVLTAEQQSQLADIQHIVTTQILGSERMVTVACKMTVETKQGVMPNLEQADRFLEQAVEGLRGASENSSAMANAQADADNALMQLRYMIDDSEAMAYEAWRSPFQTLEMFHEEYSRTYQANLGRYEAAYVSARSVSNTVEVVADDIKRGIPIVMEETETAKWDKDVDSQVINDVVLRGAGSISEHQQRCDSEVNQQLESLQAIKTSVHTALEDSEAVTKCVIRNNDNLANAISPIRLEDAIAEVRSYVHRLSYEMGNNAPNPYSSVLDDLSMVFNRIRDETGVFNADKQRLTAVIERAKDSLQATGQLVND